MHEHRHRRRTYDPTPHPKNYIPEYISQFQDIIRAIPDFPRSTPNLQSLDISLSNIAAKWDPSKDPFEKLQTAPLKSLSLNRIPLYPYFRGLATPSKFTLHDDEFDYPLDTLLDVVKNNGSLTHVELKLQFKDPTLRSSRREGPVANRLESLSMTSDAEDLKALISYIPLSSSADLRDSPERAHKAFQKPSITYLHLLQRKIHPMVRTGWKFLL